MIKKRLPLVFIMLLVFIFSNTSKSLAFRDTQNHWSSEYVTVLNSKTSSTDTKMVHLNLTTILLEQNTIQSLIVLPGITKHMQ